jgi:hypothetical protein
MNILFALTATGEMLREAKLQMPDGRSAANRTAKQGSVAAGMVICTLA